ncbi:Noc2-domain-containing protein [Ramicandelaber brevisporus]|nr:Noc2-domain-containing protein [Ramicandelaber brevisporus]
MAIKPSKATVKYQKRHLHAELERRKKAKVVKKQMKRRAKQRGKPVPNKTGATSRSAGSDDDSESSSESEDEHDSDVGDMDELDRLAMADDDDDDNNEMSDVDEEAAEQLKQLEELRMAADPEFQKYVAKSADETLDIGGSDIDDDEADAKSSSKSKPKVTIEAIKSWDEQLGRTHALTTLKQLLLAYRTATATSGTSEAVLNRVIAVAASRIPSEFAHHLAPTAEQTLPSSHASWKKLRLYVKAYLVTTLQLLRQASTAEVQLSLLQQCQTAAAYFVCFPVVARELLRELMQLWAKSASSKSEIRDLCMSIVREILTLEPQHFTEFALKGVYLTYLHHSQTGPLAEMRSQAVGLFGGDVRTAYQLAFVHIRQLAVNLRDAMDNSSNNGKDARYKIYTWKFINALQFWTDVIDSHSEVSSSSSSNANGKTKRSKDDSASLVALVYPLSQVLIGTIRLAPTVAYFPVRLHCTHMLNVLARRSNSLLSTLPFLFEVLDSPAMCDEPYSSGSKLPPFSIQDYLNCPPVYMHTRVYAETILSEAVRQLAEQMVQWSTSIAFPDLVIPAFVQLKRFIKRTKKLYSGPAGKAQTLVDKIAQHERYIEQQRTSTKYAPNTVTAPGGYMDGLTAETTPLGKYFKGTVSVQAN